MLQVGYWNIRGLAQPIRYLLEYSGAEWRDVLYCQAGPTDPVPFDKSCWLDVKNTLGLAFPNLPYLIHGEVKLSQSQAILRYVASLRPDLKLLGSSPEMEAQINMVISETADCKGRMTGLQYGQEPASSTALDFVHGGKGDSSDLPSSLNRFSMFLGTKPWIAGDQITLADFLLFEYLSCACLYSNAVYRAHGLLERATEEDSALSPTPNLRDYRLRFQSIPQIAAYLASDRFNDVRPMNNQHAKYR